MMGSKLNRVHRLEQVRPKLSERARAWLGLRPPLTAEEEAAEPKVAVDRESLSPRLLDWLTR